MSKGEAEFAGLRTSALLTASLLYPQVMGNPILQPEFPAETPIKNIMWRENEALAVILFVGLKIEEITHSARA